METTRRVDLITDLVKEQITDTSCPGQCSEAVKEAVRILLSDLLCDLKFDRDMLNELLMLHGWTPDDVEYFGIADMFIDPDEEGGN